MWENFEREVRLVMEKEGWDTLPGEKFLLEYGYNSMRNAINRHYNGVRAVRARLNDSSLDDLVEGYLND